MNTQQHEEKAATEYVYSLAEAGIHKDDCEGYDWDVVVNGDTGYFNPFATLQDAEKAVLQYIEDQADYYEGEKSYSIKYLAVRKDDEATIYEVGVDYDDGDSCQEQYYEMEHNSDCRHIARYGY
jgi:hypothetical protein